MAEFIPISEIPSPIVTLVAAAALAGGTRVYVDTNGKWAQASATNPGIATTLCRPVASGDPCAAMLDTANSLKAGVASGAITKGARVYEDASGKLTASPAAAGYLVGIAVTATSADNDGFQFIACEDEPTRFQTVTSTGVTAQIDPGFGVTPAVFVYQARTAAGADKAGTSVTWAAGVATFAGVAATDTIDLWCRLKAK